MLNWFDEELRARQAAEAFAERLKQRELIRSLQDDRERAPSPLRRRLAAMIVAFGAWLDPEVAVLRSRPAEAGHRT